MITEKHRRMIDNEHKDMPFYVCRLQKASLTRQGSLKTLEVTLDERAFINKVDLDVHGMSQNQWIKTLTGRHNPSTGYVREQLELFEKTGRAEIANPENPIRWVGSGTILILKTADKKEYLVVNQRHPLYSWGGFFDANGGLSSSIKDMLKPEDLAFRELKEELAVYEDGDKIDFTPAKLSIIPLKRPTRTIIHFKGQALTSDNLSLIVDAETGTIDFRQIRSLNIDNLNNLTFSDEETRFVNQTERVLQERPILLFSLKKVKKMFRDNTEVFPESVFLNKTHILASELKNYKMTMEILTPALKLTLEDLFK